MAEERTEFWTTIGRLLRDVRLLLTAVLVAAGLAVAVYLATPNAYVSSTTMVLITTEHGGTTSDDPLDPTELSNPLLTFNDSLSTASAVLIQSMNTKDVERQLGAGRSTRLTVDDGRSNPDLLGLNGPFLFVLARSSTPQEATDVVQDATALMREKLRDWQDSLNAPEETFVNLADVVPPTEPEPARGRATKLGIVAFALGLVLVLGIAYLRLRLASRRAPQTVPVPAPVPVPELVLEPARASTPQKRTRAPAKKTSGTPRKQTAARTPRKQAAAGSPTKQAAARTPKKPTSTVASVPVKTNDSSRR